MSNHEFENYLALVSRLLRLNRFQKDSIRDELYDHLETRISELVESGTDANEATRRALEEFGDAAVLAQKFQTVFQFNQRRWMMRFATFSIAATFLAAVLIMAMWPDQARFGAPSNSIAQDENPFAGTDDNPFDARTVDSSVASTEVLSSPPPKRRATIWSNEDIDGKLSEPADMDYEENTFREIMDEVRSEHGFNVMLDQTAKDDALDEDTLITFEIENTRLSTALRLLLQEHNATYMIKDGVLRFISLDNASDPEFFRTRMFNCRPLLEKIAANDERVGQPLQNTPQNAGAGNAAGKGGGVFSFGSQILPTKQSEQRPASDNVESSPAPADAVPVGSFDALFGNNFVPVVTPERLLVELVKTSVSPDSWNDQNGDASLTIIGGVMVVSSNQRSLDDVEEFLQELDQKLYRKTK